MSYRIITPSGIIFYDDTKVSVAKLILFLISFENVLGTLLKIMYIILFILLKSLIKARKFI